MSKILFMQEEDVLQNQNNNRLSGSINNSIDYKKNIDEHRIKNEVSTDWTDLSSCNGNLTVIQRFYSGSCVFVTGATGFMGKVLIEKLLRSCPNIDSIYMMIREKKGRKMEQRIDDLVSSPCFDRIKKEYPEFRSKLHAVAGDISLERLGISDSDRSLLEEQVDIVFHMAATVRFDEHLKTAILINVRGTKETLDLCRTFKKLRSVIHVSTAYSNCPDMEIDERFYEPPLDSGSAIHMAETLDLTTVDYLSHKLTGKWPNTYSFTKAMSEHVVKKYGQGLPIAVFRPSIVVCTKSEPMPGWIDNLYGPSGVMVACAVGVLRTMQTNKDDVANMVPCDMVINGIIAVAWDVAENRVNEDIPVYNYVTPSSNLLTWRRFQEHFTEHGEKIPPSRTLWHPTLTTINNRYLYLFCRLLLHFLPALLMDIGLFVTNKSPKMMKIYRKVHKFTDVIAYFATKTWSFETKNVEVMWKRLHENDKELFFFDMDSLDWYRFLKDTCSGVRLYLLNDPPQTIPAGRKQYQRTYILHRSMQLILVCVVIWVLSEIISLVPMYSTK